MLGVASYIAPPAFSDKLKGHFFVPFAPDGTPDAEIQERLTGNSYGSIPTTAVHEAYPGHHWHLVWRKANPSKLRRVYSTPYFSEGWALYAERVMRERGFFTEPLHELQHLDATMFRAAGSSSTRRSTWARCRSTRPSVHDRQGGDARAGRARRSRPLLLVADAGVVLPDRLPRDPRIRDRYLTARGVSEAAKDAPVDVIRDFHDALTSSGSLPLGLAERAVLASVPAGA